MANNVIARLRQEQEQINQININPFPIQQSDLNSGYGYNRQEFPRLYKDSLDKFGKLDAGLLAAKSLLAKKKQNEFERNQYKVGTGQKFWRFAEGPNNSITPIPVEGYGVIYDKAIPNRIPDRFTGLVPKGYLPNLHPSYEDPFKRFPKVDKWHHVYESNPRRPKRKAFSLVPLEIRQLVQKQLNWNVQRRAQRMEDGTYQRVRRGDFPGTIRTGGGLKDNAVNSIKKGQASASASGQKKKETSILGGLTGVLSGMASSVGKGAIDSIANKIGGGKYTKQIADVIKDGISSEKIQDYLNVSVDKAKSALTNKVVEKVGPSTVASVASAIRPSSGRAPAASQLPLPPGLAPAASAPAPQRVVKRGGRVVKAAVRRRPGRIRATAIDLL